MNPDGWGIFLTDEKEVLFDKENIRADKSARLKDMLSGDVSAKDAIAHIRLATIGYDEMENTHPFRGYDLSGREWVLAHNGTIFDSDALTRYTYEQDGETDSERIFLYLIDRMNEAIKKKQGALDEDDRFDILQAVVTELSPRNKLNLLIYYEGILYVHTNYAGSLYVCEKDKGLFFSTRPLGVGVWKSVPFTRLMSYRDGKLLQPGESHGYEYVPDENSIRALYLAYSGL